MSSRIGVALFGVGRAGTIHFLNLIRNHRIVILYIVEKDVQKAKDLATKYHLQDTKVVDCDNPDTVFTDNRVGAVLVAAPTFEHENIVRQALLHKKAVFCEKPISQKDGATRTLYEEAEKAGRPLFCSFNRRFDPSFSSLRERVRSGEVGTIHIVKSCSRDSPLPSTEYLRISGGMFHDCGVHDIDILCWILGEYPCEVFTMAQSHIKDIRDLGDVDTVLISLKFPSGVIGSIDLSRFAAYGYDQRVEVFGTKGMLVSENQHPTELKSYLKTGMSQDRIKYSFPQRYADSYVIAMDHFLDVVEGKADISVTKLDAIYVSAIATACEESYKAGKPVKPDLNGNLPRGCDAD